MQKNALFADIKFIKINGTGDYCGNPEKSKRA